MRGGKWLRGVALTAVAGVLCVSAASMAADRTLDIYFLDMVGGGSTLIVTPAGESVLIDTGSLRPEGRDVGRIVRACRVAGLERIDWLVTTHFHSDHFGAILPLSKAIPIARFIDKGALPPEKNEDIFARDLYPKYLEATGGKAEPLAAGGDIPLKQAAGSLAVRLHCIAAEGRIEGFDGDIDAPVAGHEIRKPDTSDNVRSIALMLSCGDFRFFAGGDITWNLEHHLAVPVNRVGRVDLYQVTHHGLDMSNHPLLLKALSPTVAVAMNGPDKGIMERTFRDLKAVPGLEALYQLHYNTAAGDAGNTAHEFIANQPGEDKGRFVRVRVDAASRTFTVQIDEDGPQRRFAWKGTPGK